MLFRIVEKPIIHVYISKTGVCSVISKLVKLKKIVLDRNEKYERICANLCYIFVIKFRFFYNNVETRQETKRHPGNKKQTISKSKSKAQIFSKMFGYF